MNTDDIILVANAAIQELGLTDSQTYYIDGVLTMAMLLRAEEYETQLYAMDQSLLRLVTCSNDLQAKLDAMTAERDVLIVQRASYLRGDMFERGEAASEPAPSLGRIHYAATQPGHLEP